MLRYMLRETKYQISLNKRPRYYERSPPTNAQPPGRYVKQLLFMNKRTPPLLPHFLEE